MWIRRHDPSYIVELSDDSAWRTWPADIAKTLLWLPTIDIEIVEIEHEICSHALADCRSGLLVRAIPANVGWPIRDVLHALAAS
jgi:hypothetical protein